MAARAAIVTGASSGIGLAIARVLGEEGFAITIAARRPEKLEGAVAGLDGRRLRRARRARERARGGRHPEVVSAHRERYGRLDVLVNNAGLGYASPVSELETKWLDSRSTVNLRSIPLFYRESLDMLRPPAPSTATRSSSTRRRSRASAASAGNAVYSATKHGVIGWTDSMNRELNQLGIKSTALCPAWVDTPMTDFIKEHVPAEGMIRARGHLRGRALPAQAVPATASCPEMMFVIPGDTRCRLAA